MSNSLILAPSLLAANPVCYGDEIREVERFGARYLHFDVMDGRFVPNLSFGSGVLKGLRKVSRLFFDVHLMLEEPLMHVQSFIDAGADSITVHIEAADDPWAVHDLCKKNAVDFGIALCPQTPVSVIEPYMRHLDILLIMGVNPGFGGQLFLKETPERIAEAFTLRMNGSAAYRISVDGGINPKTGGLCAGAGADILVAGSSIFNASDRAASMQALCQSAL